MCTDRGELSPLQMFYACVVIWVVDEVDRCITADNVEHLTMPPMSHEATTFVPPALPGAADDVLGLALDAEGDWDCQTSDVLSSLIFVPVYEWTSSSFKRSVTSFGLTVRLMPGTYSNPPYVA